MGRIGWELTIEEEQFIGCIIARLKGSKVTLDWFDVRMDLTACHNNGCPLDFQRMLDAPDLDLLHDIIGINKHISRASGKLLDCFLPRFAKKE